MPHGLRYGRDHNAKKLITTNAQFGSVDPQYASGSGSNHFEQSSALEAQFGQVADQL
jgi:hypothetical protein